VKLCLLKYFKWLPKGKGHIFFFFFDQTTKGTLETQRALCSSVEAYSCSKNTGGKVHVLVL